jgi:uroporphyrinogen decarboxylase
VNKPEDVVKLKIPDPATAPVIGKRIECARLNRKIGRKAGIQANPTGMAGSILGREKLMRWYLKEPDAIHAIFRKVTDYILRTADLFIEEFGEGNCSIHEGFPLDSNQLISPNVFREFGSRYIREIHERLMEKGIKHWSEIHLCGSHMDNLKHWENIPLAPRTIISVGSEMDIKKTADFFGDDHIIAGNVSTSLLANGTPEEIIEHCREIIMSVKEHPGGFILCPACQMPPLTPPVNVHAMVKAARIYGRY